MVTLGNRRIFVDSMILIYLLEQHSEYGDIVGKVLDEAKEVGFSTLLYGEVLAGMYRAKATAVAENFLELCRTSPTVKVCPFTDKIAVEFARLRAEYTELRSPDAIHLATAMVERADFFLTNDKRLPKLNGLKIVQLTDVV